MKRSIFRSAIAIVIVSIGTSAMVNSVMAADVDFGTDVAPILRKYCVGCHGADEPEGRLSLDSFAGAMQGGKHGAAIAAGKSGESRLIQLLEGTAEPKMPPKDEAQPSPEEVGILKSWIDAGARGPRGGEPLPELPEIPKVKPVGDVRRPINAIACAPHGNTIAVARNGAVEVHTVAAGETGTGEVRVLDGSPAHVNDVTFSADGTKLVAVGGESSLYGQIVVWNTADWSKVQLLNGHRDSIYAVDISPDGALVATGSYDQQIKVWDLAAGQELRTLVGHNGPVFDLAFHPTGKILASASDDRTVKLWDVATGARLDTFGQPTKGQYTVAFSPDGKYVVGGGVDNRLRVWELREMGREGASPLVYSRFAHEGSILKLTFCRDGKRLVSSAEDATVKLWEADTFTQLVVRADQSDWCPALGVSHDNQSLWIGRLDGTLSIEPLAIADEGLKPQVTSNADVPTRVPAVAPNVPMDQPVANEVEPNDEIATATLLPTPGVIAGVLKPATAVANGMTGDVDLYRFEAVQGQTWILETKAARDGSPADTKIDVLDASGQPVQRLKLRAIRDSFITFRPIDSNQGGARLENWEEMKLRQYLYMNGEVVRLFLAPRGPDSTFDFFTSNGARRCYFDTSASTHANEEPVYIVEPHAVDDVLVDNGLPVFPVYFSNDDDGERKLGSDSRVTFTAPADGVYLVRVTDVRGFGGDDYKYQLSIREPAPDFGVTIGGRGAKVGAGSGQQFTVRLDRIDGFDGEVRIDIENLPAGFHVTTPIIVQAEHLNAAGVINADAGATAPDKAATDAVRMTATATINGREVTHPIENLGEFQLAEKPKVSVRFELDPEAPASMSDNGALVIAPGQMISAMLKIERNGFDGEVRFDVENMPHGVIVDDIGLSGVLIRTNETERRVYISAEDWVPDSTRQIYAVGRTEGNQASWPITLHVRRSGPLASAGSATSPNSP